MQYIITRNEVKGPITEEYLKELYDMTSFAVCSEKDYETWKKEKLQLGLLKEVQEGDPQ